MSWYSTPLSPLDPVVPSQMPKGPVRYMRDNFTATGQNSYVKPPAQDQSMWQSLLNIQPITQGILNQRWGYNVFAQSFSLSIISIVYIRGMSPAFGFVATVTATSVTGLLPGAAVTIVGNSNPLFNGTSIVDSVNSAANQFTIFFVNPGGNTSGTGGTLQAFLPANISRLYDFQSDAIGTRAIIATGSTGIVALSEAGAIYNPNLFTPANPGAIMRSLTSRNYQYFCDGNTSLNPSTHLTGDSLKWNGASNGGVSNIGISTTDVTINAAAGGGTAAIVVGPNLGSSAIDIPAPTPDPANPWTNPSGIYTGPASPAFVNLNQFYVYNNGVLLGISPNSTNTSDSLQSTGFSFNYFPSPIVEGVQVSLSYLVTTLPNTATSSTQIYAQLVKGDVPVGSPQNLTVIPNGVIQSLTFGGPNTTWGASFVPSDITSTGFGVIFYGMGAFTPVQVGPSFTGVISPGVTVKIANATLTVYGANNPGVSNSSGTGVGIVSEVSGGGASLVIGRTYYLVGNNNLTGHFSDLSPASASTGPCVDSYFNLVLATYNDPQVTNKYLLATADGGDPSILYEVPVIAGTYLTIASWAIVSNVLTLTGTYTGTPPANGTAVTVQGLIHGNYINGAALSVTSTSATTLVAALTQPNDSATEAGIAGATTFAIPNTTTRVIDATPDPSLVLTQDLLYTDTFGNEYGVALNDPPPAGNILLKHQGRLWMAGVSGATHSVFFSKSVTELTLPNGFIAGKYEEAWPGSNYFDVSDGAESVSGLLTDGTTLYIGTQNHIRRLIGNSPANFQEPQIVHPEVGLANQEVWQLTFMQGAPSGAVWMTPDFRVIQSDFNTYVDIGTPVQNILNALQPTAKTLAHAAFVADGEYELYILAVPYLQSTYCDTHLVFDLRARQWFVWQPAGGSLSLLYNVTQAAVPQWLFINGAATALNIYSESATTDNGTAIQKTATTTWMNMGEPTRRKILNEIQIYGDTEMTMNVYGANNLQDFNGTPRPIVYNRTLKQSPFGVWTLYLTGSKTKHRYYQYSFNSSNGQVPLLGSYAISFTPLDDV
jgi:hypothetical protein